MLIHVRFWGFGTHILILHEFSTFPLGYPHAYPQAEFAAPLVRLAMPFPAQHGAL